MDAEEEALAQEITGLLSWRIQLADVLGDEVPEDPARLDRRCPATVRYAGEEMERDLIYPTSASPWLDHGGAIFRGEFPRRSYRNTSGSMRKNFTTMGKDEPSDVR